MKILLLEDDYMLAESMKLLLESEGMDVEVVNTPDEVYEKTFNEKFDLYIFDINLQTRENGIDILKNLKDANDKTPTIFITALTDLKTIEKAFKVGADDFIKNPFEIEDVLNHLMQNYPNPFNPSTIIEFAIPEKTNVSLFVFNSIGEKVAELVNQEMDAGYHTVNFNASNLSSGIYFYRISTNDFSKTRKMIMLK